MNSKGTNEYNSHKNPDANNTFMKTNCIKGKKKLRNFKHKRFHKNIFTTYKVLIQKLSTNYNKEIYYNVQKHKNNI